MKLETIKEYIKEHHNHFSRESIEIQLARHGAKKEDVAIAFSELGLRGKHSKKKNTYSKTAMTMIIIGILLPVFGSPILLLGVEFFILFPFVGFLLVVAGLILAHKAKKKSKGDALTKSAIFAGYIAFVLYILIMIGYLIFIGSLAWYGVNQLELQNELNESDLPTDSSGARLTFESINSAGEIVIRNSGGSETEIVSVMVAGYAGSCDTYSNSNMIPAAQTTTIKPTQNCNLESFANVEVILETKDSFINAIAEVD